MLLEAANYQLEMKICVAEFLKSTEYSLYVTRCKFKKYKIKYPRKIYMYGTHKLA